MNNLEYRVVKKDGKFLTLEFEIVLSGTTPEKVEWDWGDGTPGDETGALSAQHRFPIPAGGPSFYTITAVCHGPEDCQDRIQRTIEIPAQPAPKFSAWCGLWPLLVAFFMAVTGGGFVAQIVARIIAPITGLSWLEPLVVLLVGLSVLLILLWYYSARKKSCPKPVKCNWLGIGWVTSLASSWISLYLKGCCPTWWWLICIGLFVVALLLFIRWFKHCHLSTKYVLIHFAVWLGASILMTVWVAQKIITQCL